MALRSEAMGSAADDFTTALEAARARPDDVRAQMAAAYACDRAGDEARAVTFYDAAWRLGVPAAERTDFVIGYGSTLRNVRRVDESLSVLAELIALEPHNHAARCFHALSLHSAGHDGLALAEMLDVILSLENASPHVTKYRQALAFYGSCLRNGSKT